MKYFFYIVILFLNIGVHQFLEVVKFNDSLVYVEHNENDLEFDEFNESSKQYYNIERPVFNLKELMKQDLLPGIEDENWPYLRNKRNKSCPACACGIRTYNRIVGGSPVVAYEFPFQIAITYKKRFTCGGTLINNYYILTAAHCTHGLEIQHIQCRFLVKHLKKSPESFYREVAQIWRPKGYNSESFKHDLSIMKLQSEVPISATSILRPVCLPNNRLPYRSKIGTLIGWGRTKENKPLSQVLKKVKVPIFSYKQCRKTGIGNRVNAEQICAGVGGKNVCSGDSGGPLLVYRNKRYIEIGIVSHGYGCAVPNLPAIFPNVAKYMPYIMKIASEGACFCTE